MTSRRFWIRCGFDRPIVEAILVGDEYSLEAWRATGLPVETIVDVGAHVGAFTCRAAELWPDARIIAIEPAPDAWGHFRLNTAHLDDVSLCTEALVGRGAPKRVHLADMPDGNPAARFVLELFDEQGMNANGSPAPRVPATDMIALFDEFAIERIDILKLDCEGAERAILEDLASAGQLANVGYICGEWHRKALIPGIRHALAATHDLEMDVGDHENGLFLARPRAWV